MPATFLQRSNENQNPMNKDTRKQLTDKIGTIEELISELETIRDEEQEKYDNMPEGLQSGEKGEAMQSAIDALESAISSADEVKSYMEDAAQ